MKVITMLQILGCLLLITASFIDSWSIPPEATAFLAGFVLGRIAFALICGRVDYVPPCRAETGDQ